MLKAFASHRFRGESLHPHSARLFAKYEAYLARKRVVDFDQLVLRTASPSDLLVELTTWLRDRGIVPREIRCGQGSLEDVFLALTDR